MQHCKSPLCSLSWRTTLGGTCSTISNGNKGFGPISCRSQRYSLWQHSNHARQRTSDRIPVNDSSYHPSLSGLAVQLFRNIYGVHFCNDITLFQGIANPHLNASITVRLIQVKDAVLEITRDGGQNVTLGLKAYEVR